MLLTPSGEENTAGTVVREKKLEIIVDWMRNSYNVGLWVCVRRSQSTIIILKLMTSWCLVCRKLFYICLVGSF